MAKHFETVFEIAGKVAGSFDKSLLSAGKNLQQLQKQISALSPVDANIAKFRELKTQLNSTETEYDQLGQKIAQMAKQMHAAGPPTKKMVQEFELAKLRAAQLKQSITEQSAALHRQRQALAATGIQTTNLHGSMQKLANQQRLAAEAQQRMTEIQQRAAAVEQRMIERQRQMIALQEKHTAAINRNKDAIAANEAVRANLRGQMFDAAAVGAAASAPIVQAAQFEKAMAGVAKQVQGARDDSGQLTSVYHDMAKQIQQMGREIPITTDQIAEMVAAGARMGVGNLTDADKAAGKTAEQARQELLQFTKLSAMMATAFEMPAGELADQMGKIAGLYKIPIKNIDQLADTINYLDDNAIAKGGDIISFLQRVGGVAGSVKISGKEMAALGSTLLTMGETTETAGTAVNAMMAKFAAADKGTKGFKEAVQQLGLSTSEIQSGMATDAVATLQKVAEAIKQLPEDQRVGVMVDLVGMEHQDTLGKLVNGMDEFRSQLNMANSEAAKGSMSKEFQANLSLTTSQWQIMKNTVTEVSVALGTALLPAVNGVFQAIAPVAAAVADFARENQALVSVVGGVVVGLAALKVSSIAVAYAWTFVKGGALMLNGALLAVRTAYMLSTGAMVASEVVSKRVLVLSKLMTAAQWLWNAALAANPVGLVVVAIAGLVAAGVMLYRNWDEVKAGAIALWDTITSTIGQIPTVLLQWGMQAGSATVDMVQRIMQVFGNLDFLAPFKFAWQLVSDFINSIDLTESGAKLIQTLIDGIKAKAGALVNSVKETLAGVREYLPFSDAKTGPLSQLTASGKAIMTTLGEGVNQGTGSLTGAVNGALQQDLSVPAGMGQSAGPSITYSPTIQVTGSNADQIRQNVAGVLRDDRSAFDRQMQQYMNNEARLSFA